MKILFSNLWNLFALLTFSILVILFFGNFTTLRLPALGAMYKEYLTGVIVLVIFYANRYFLYPYYYLKNRKVNFMIISISCLIAAVFIESFLIYPQIYGILQKSYPEQRVVKYIIIFALYMFLRDAAILFTSFAWCEFERSLRKNDSYEMRIRELANEIPIDQIQEDKDTNMAGTESTPSSEDLAQEDVDNPNSSLSEIPEFRLFLSLNKIWYCEQARNATIIHDINDNLYLRYGSLKKIITLIGFENVIQITRDIVLIKKYIQHVEKDQVVIENPISHDTKSFQWSTVFFKEEYLSMKVMADDLSLDQNATLQSADNDKKTNYSEQRLTLLNQKKAKSVYKYISKHPFCKSDSIGKETHISTGTLHRILAQLKADGLIEYVGSKKTGGYRAVKKNDNITNM